MLIPCCMIENEWVPKHAVIELKNGTTLESHCSKINNHVLPKIGHMPIDEITIMILVKLFADMRKPGVRVDKKDKKSPLASRTIQYAYDVTNSIFQRATEWRVLIKNPLGGVNVHKLAKRIKRPGKTAKITLKKMRQSR